MTQPVRLAIVDDHPLLREGVARSLSETGAFEICGEGASADDAIRLAAEAQPDILLHRPQHAGRRAARPARRSATVSRT